MLALRGTQQEFVDKAVEVLKSKSTRKQVMVAPVAYGKSICIANIVKNLDGPTIVLQPNKELLKQNYEKFTSYGYEASIFSASLNTKELGYVTYATIGSIKSHVDAVKKLKVKYLIIDECHLATSRSSGTSQFIKDLKIKNVLGVTATPVILTNTYEGSMLKTMDSFRNNLFTGIHHVVQIKELTESNYWAKLNYDIRVTHVDKLVYNTSGSEYTQESMDLAYDENATEGRCIEAVEELRKEGRKSILVFVPGVTAAIALQKKIPGSAVVHGGTKKSERNEIVAKFKNLEIDVVINVEVFTTGFDHPQLDAIVMARPTASIGLYYQILGRGTRIHPDKVDTKVIDLSGNVSNFGPIENLNYEYIEGWGWGLFSNEDCLTGVPIKSRYKRPTKSSIRESLTRAGLEQTRIHSQVTLWFGKHKGKQIKDVPIQYLNYILDTFTFDSKKSRDLKESIEIVLKLVYQ